MERERHGIIDLEAFLAFEGGVDIADLDEAGGVVAIERSFERGVDRGAVGKGGRWCGNAAASHRARALPPSH